MKPWPEEAVTAAYIHIPFCTSRCSYCAFCSFAGVTTARHRAYVRALTREISQTGQALAADPATKTPLASVYAGGGTPSLLATSQLVALLETIKAYLGLADTAECTLEANPGTAAKQDFFQLRQAGWNRISFGLQAAQPHLLALLGRTHTASDLVTDVQAAAQAGFEQINVDIMVGLPGQRLDDVADTVDLLLRLPVTHVSYYSLILEEDTPLARRLSSGQLPPVDDEQERQAYWLIRRRLARQGLIPMEISSSARPDSICRHHVTYWRGLPYHGFGCGAHRFIKGWRGQNTDSLQGYLDTWLDQPLPTIDLSGPHGRCPDWPAASWHEQVDRQEAMREMMLLGFRLADGIDDRLFQSRFGCSLWSVFSQELSVLQADQLISQTGSRLQLTDRGLDFANVVFRQFV